MKTIYLTAALFLPASSAFSDQATLPVDVTTDASYFGHTAACKDEFDAVSFDSAFSSGEQTELDQFLANHPDCYLIPEGSSGAVIEFSGMSRRALVEFDTIVGLGAAPAGFAYWTRPSDLVLVDGGAFMQLWLEITEK